MIRQCTPIAMAALLSAGCQMGSTPDAFVIPGPTVPSTVPTTTPYVWDTHEELAVWVQNEVARGSLTLEGSGNGAFIRIDRADRPWVLRGILDIDRIELLR